MHVGSVKGLRLSFFGAKTAPNQYSNWRYLCVCLCVSMNVTPSNGPSVQLRGGRFLGLLAPPTVLKMVEDDARG